jgi:hypothetical protein
MVAPQETMTLFQALLKPDLMTPMAEQERASRELPQVVKGSHLHWWTNKGSIPTQGKVLLLVVAPYSHYDLALLDELDAALARPRVPKRLQSVPIYVSNLERYQTVEQLTEDIPGITQIPFQTPVVAVWENGTLTKSAWGKSGRDLAADTLGLSSEDLNQRVVTKVPKYAPPTGDGK